MCEHCDAQDLDYLGSIEGPAIDRLYQLVNELIPNGLPFSQRLALTGHLWEVIMEHKRAIESQHKEQP